MIHYVQVQNQYLPVNLQACDVKCFTCGGSCPPDKLSEHLSTHVQPKFNQSQTFHNPPKKIALSSLLTKGTNEEDDISVSSMLPDEIPEDEKKKKNVFMTVGASNVIDHDCDLTDEGLHGGDVLTEDIRSYLPFDRQEEQQANGAEIVEILNKVKFKRQKIDVKNKKIKVYESSRKSAEIDDVGGSECRVRKIQNVERKEYAIERIQKKQVSQDTDTSSERFSNNTIYLPAKRKDPISSTKICTSIHQVHPNHRLKSQNSQTKSTRGNLSLFPPKYRRSSDGSDHIKMKESDSEISKYRMNEDLVCSKCKGFYCDGCKSTIPAIYRPVPDEEGKYHMHPDAKAMEFYREHYYRKGQNSEKVCLNCESLKMPQ